MALPLYEDINIYQQAAGEEVPQLYSLADLVTGSDLVDTKKRAKKKVPQLYSGSQYGFLTVNKRVKALSPNGVQYRCKCKCGGKVMCTRKEILHRAKLEVGCLGNRCPLGPDEIKAWYNPEFALRLQLKYLLKHSPEIVDNVWGGTAYEGLHQVASRKGGNAMVSSLLPLVGVHCKRWWMHRKNEALPYSLFNIELEDDPGFCALEGLLNYVAYKEVLYSLSELALMFNLSVQDVRNWRRNPSDKQVMRRIIEESNYV